MFDDVRDTLRVTGVPEPFRRWAEHKEFLPQLWSALRPNAETRAFENAADHLRAEAVRAAAGLRSAAPAVPGPELDLYHYLTPKLLLICAAARGALEGDGLDRLRTYADVERVERGAPADMCWPAGDTLPIRPDGLEAPGDPAARAAAAEGLIGSARFLLRLFPRPVGLTPGRLARAGGDPASVLRETRRMERALAETALDVAARRGGAEASPFPAPRRVAFARGEPCAASV
jgi:hypothetical protein